MLSLIPPSFLPILDVAFAAAFAVTTFLAPLVAETKVFPVVLSALPTPLIALPNLVFDNLAGNVAKNFALAVVALFIFLSSSVKNVPNASIGWPSANWAAAEVVLSNSAFALSPIESPSFLALLLSVHLKSAAEFLIKSPAPLMIVLTAPPNKPAPFFNNHEAAFINNGDNNNNPPVIKPFLPKILAHKEVWLLVALACSSVFSLIAASCAFFSSSLICFIFSSALIPLSLASSNAFCVTLLRLSSYAASSFSSFRRNLSISLWRADFSSSPSSFLTATFDTSLIITSTGLSSGPLPPNPFPPSVGSLWDLENFALTPFNVLWTFSLAFLNDNLAYSLKPPAASIASNFSSNLACASFLSFNVW